MRFATVPDVERIAKHAGRQADLAEPPDHWLGFAARQRPPSTRTSKHSGPPRGTRNRDIRAAGGWEIRVDGVDYRADRPRFAGGLEATAVVRQGFGPVERAMFRVLGFRQYLLLRRPAS